MPSSATNLAPRGSSITVMRYAIELGVGRGCLYAREGAMGATAKAHLPAGVSLKDRSRDNAIAAPLLPCFGGRPCMGKREAHEKGAGTGI